MASQSKALRFEEKQEIILQSMLLRRYSVTLDRLLHTQNVIDKIELI